MVELYYRVTYVFTLSATDAKIKTLLCQESNSRLPHYRVPVVQLERPVNLGVRCLGVSKLLSFSHGENVAVRDNPLEYDLSTVSLA